MQNGNSQLTTAHYRLALQLGSSSISRIVVVSPGSLTHLKKQKREIDAPQVSKLGEFIVVSHLHTLVLLI